MTMHEHQPREKKKKSGTDSPTTQDLHGSGGDIGTEDLHGSGVETTDLHGSSEPAKQS